MLKLARYIIALIIILNCSYSATRIAYLRPGPMMKIPFSMIGTSPYLFAAGFGTEFHNLAPINTAKGF